MEASHDQSFMCKSLKISCKTCAFCCKTYPFHICIVLVFFLSYFFFPWVFTFLIYASPLVGIPFIVNRVLLGIDGQKIKHVEENDRRKKFAKSRRSFKSKYGDRSHLNRRNVKEKSDNDTDAIFSKSLNDLLFDKTSLVTEKPKEIRKANVESSIGRGERSSSYNSVDGYGNSKRRLVKENLDVSEDNDDEPHNKVVQWTKDDQKNVMDLGLSETERNKRLESLMVRRRSRKNLGFQEELMSENNNKVHISSIKIAKMNPFIEDNSCGKNEIPGSAPSFMLETRNPFDLPYDPHEEKLDLTADNFHEEFMVGHGKEPRFCRHESFSLGAFSNPEIAHDKHERSFYKDLATKHKAVTRLGTSTVDNPEEDESSDRVVGVPYKEDRTQTKTQEIDVPQDAANAEESDLERHANCPERKADINFFYGNNKQVGHAASSSMLSDLQVEVSDDGSAPILDDLDIDKHCQEADLYMLQSNHIHESSGASQSSVDQAAPPTEAAVGQAPVTSSSPKSVVQRGFSTNPASPYNRTREADALPNSQDQNDHQL